MTVISITGHRPEGIPDPLWTRAAMRDAYKEMNASLVIQGMAAGVDLWSAAEAWNSRIPFMAARPWATHTARKADNMAYQWVLENAVKVVNVSDVTKYPGKFIYHTRNKYMVDNSEAVLTIWDGSVYGGTYDCFKYALAEGKPIYRIDPKLKVVHGWLNK